MASTGWRNGILSPVLRGWARYWDFSVPARIRNLDLTPNGLPSARDLRLQAERAELWLASLHRVGPTVSRPSWEREVAQAEQEVNDLWRRWADRAL